MNDELEPVGDGRSGRDESEPSAPPLGSSDAPRPAGSTARRSRPSPGIGIVKSIDAVDDFSSISIRPSNKPLANAGNQPSAPLTSPKKGPPDQAEVNDQAASRTARPVAVPEVAVPENVERGPAHGNALHPLEPAVGANAWPQWLLAVALFAGVFWYLLSVEPAEQSPKQEPRAGDNLTHE